MNKTDIVYSYSSVSLVKMIRKKDETIIKVATSYPYTIMREIANTVLITRERINHAKNRF